jgi:predicted membrane-bound spermidine synthase
MTLSEGPSKHRRTFLFSFKKLLSFVWPVNIERSGDLRLSFENGELVVNKGRASYSYGNLLFAFQNAFQEVPLDWSQIKSVLFLGFGAGSVSKHILNTYADTVKITGVDQDSQLLDWYERYFFDERIRTVHADARAFVDESNDTYDLLIVDLFDELDVPAVFCEADFLRKLRDLLHPKGVLVFNFVVDNPKQKTNYEQLLLQLSELFHSVKVNEQMDINRIIFCK